MRAAASLRALLALGLAFLPAVAAADDAYKPKTGQPGKDVVWVPTPQALVNRSLDMAELRAGDYLMDLGSGDGRLVITAAKRGATALGIEYDADLVAFSQRAATREGVASKATFVKADLFETDFSKATVITMFLSPTLNLKLRPKLLALAPGTRIVSTVWAMDTWIPDRTDFMTAEQGCDSGWCTAHLWIVPATFAGSYRIATGELTLTQEFQALGGTLKSQSNEHKVSGTVRGTEAYFTAGGRTYRAKLNGKNLELLP